LVVSALLGGERSVKARSRDQVLMARGAFKAPRPDSVLPRPGSGAPRTRITCTGQESCCLAHSGPRIPVSDQFLGFWAGILGRAGAGGKK